MTDRKAKQRRLERAGFRYYEGGWLPEKNPAGPAFEAQLMAYRHDIVEMLDEPAKPRGRPVMTEAIILAEFRRLRAERKRALRCPGGPLEDALIADVARNLRVSRDRVRWAAVSDLAGSVAPAEAL